MAAAQSPGESMHCEPRSVSIVAAYPILTLTLPQRVEAGSLRLRKPPPSLTEAAATPSASCAGAKLLITIDRKEVDRQHPQLVLVRHTEVISWSDPFAAVRTVYEKPGKVFPVSPVCEKPSKALPASSPLAPPSATAVDTVIPAGPPAARLGW